MLALRKDVKVGLTIGAIVVAVVGVYAGLSSLASEKPADTTARLQTTPDTTATATPKSTPITTIADRTGTPKTVTPTTPNTLSNTAPSLMGTTPPAQANPVAPVASGNRSDDPWASAFTSGSISPAVTVTPEPGRSSNANTANSNTSPADVINSLNGAKTASTNDGSGTIAGGTQTTLIKTDSPTTRPAGMTINPGDKNHTIAVGDTFSSIAAEYYGDANAFRYLIEANPNVNPGKLKPGMIIRVPAIEKKAKSDTTDVPAVATIDPTKQYVVKVGDSLHKIASTLYGDISYATKIYDANKTLIGADPAKLKVGMTLSLPEAPKKK